MRLCGAPHKRDNQLFARIRNLGPNPAQNVTVNYYYRDNTTGLGFPVGATFIGTQAIGFLASGANVSKSVPWVVPVPPTTGGHWCIGVVASSPVDPPNGASPPWDNNVGVCNIGVLYSRAGTAPRKSGESTVIAMPVKADFRFENPGSTTDVFVLAPQDSLPTGWTIVYRVGGVPIPIPYQRTLSAHQVVRVEFELTPPLSAPDGQQAFVRVVQWRYVGFPYNPEAVTGGIMFPCTVDLHPPAPVTDLRTSVALDDHTPPNALPMMLVEWSPVTLDSTGGPEKVAYYTLYRDTTSTFTPGPTNKVADVAVDIETARPGYQYFDERVSVIPGITPKYCYIVRVHDEAGYESANSNVATVSGVEPGDDTRPRSLTLSPNVPNPSTRGTQIIYDLAAAGPVKVAVYDTFGARVVTLVDCVQTAGRKVVNWNGRDDDGAAVRSGIYFSRVETAGVVKTGKIVILK